MKMGRSQGGKEGRRESGRKGKLNPPRNLRSAPYIEK